MFLFLDTLMAIIPYDSNLSMQIYKSFFTLWIQQFIYSIIHLSSPKTSIFYHKMLCLTSITKCLAHHEKNNFSDPTKIH